MTCDSLHFHSDAVYINQSIDTTVTLNYSYDNTTLPELFYPAYTITLSDTSDFVFRGFLASSIITPNAIFNITYKNANIPLGTVVTGTFNIGISLECSYPITFIFNDALSTEINTFENNVILFPNPTTGKLSITLGNQDHIQATLINSLGQTVFTKNYKSTHSIQLNINGPSGVYFLQLETSSGETTTMKVVKE
jgi:hypothetical protein